MMEDTFLNHRCLHNFQHCLKLEFDSITDFNFFFFLNDLFLYLAIDTVFHPSGIIQNGMKISSKSHV